MENNTNKKSFAYKVGNFLGTLVVGLIGTCVAAVLVALTAKFIFWLF